MASYYMASTIYQSCVEWYPMMWRALSISPWLKAAAAAAVNDADAKSLLAGLGSSLRAAAIALAHTTLEG